MAEGNSPSDEIINDIQKMVTHIRKESRRRGKRAKLLPADYVRAIYRTARAQNMANCDNPTDKIYFSDLNNKIYPSKTPFAKLTRTVISELRLEESATDKYVIVRMLEDGYTGIVSGYYTVIEDPEGNACTLLIYNFPLEELTGTVGCALIIKEPCFKMGMHGIPFIQCDCPTDIFILRPCFYLYHLAGEIEWKNPLEEGIVHDVLMRDFVPQNPGQWCARGDELVQERQLAAAREAYRLGVSYCSRDDPFYKTLRFKLLDLHLFLNWYERAINACKDLLEEFPDHRETLFILGQSYCKVRNYRRALITYERYCELYPDGEVLETMLLEVKERIREDGIIDVERLRKISRERPFDPIQCAEYFGPIEIMRISGRGQGLVLLENVTKGRILFVSKALVTYYLQEHPAVLVEGGNKEEDQLDVVSSENISKLTHLIYKNPNFIGSHVFKLFTGSYTDKPVEQFCYPETKKEAICDVEKIRAIYQCNKFMITETIDGEIIEKGEGLFLFPSYLNHNCSPNVDIEFYNDIMVGRARMNLKADTELTISYVPLDTDFVERTEMLRRRGINRCLCATCKRRR